MAHRLYALLTKQNSLIRLHCLPFRLHLSDTLLCGKAICKFQGDYSKFSAVWIFRTFMVRVFLPIYRDYYMVTFISSPISSRGKQYQPKAKGRGLIPLFKGWCGPWYESNLVIIYISLIYYKKNWNKISKIYQFFFFLFVSSLVSSIVIRLVRTLLDIFTIFFSFLGPYFHNFVNFPCGIDPNYVKISTKRVKDVSHFDFVMSTLSMTFQGT